MEVGSFDGGGRFAYTCRGVKHGRYVREGETMPGAEPADRIETWFLIPLVRDSEPTRQHVATLWGLLRDEIYRVAGGWTGPSEVIALREVRAIPGGWEEDPTPRTCREDVSRRYTVMIEEKRVPDLQEVLVRAANSFDQRVIQFVVLGRDRSVKRDETKGFLKGDPAGG